MRKFLGCLLATTLAFAAGAAAAQAPRYTELKPALPVETRPLADVSDVLARLKAGKIVGRTVVRP